jgi:signal transduction histidine kinase
MGSDEMRARKNSTKRPDRTSPRRIAVLPAGILKRAGFDPIQLLEIAAHDLRNPISGILAAGQYLLEDAGAVLDEPHLAMLQSIDSSSRSMLRLIDDVIELAGIESGEMRLDIKSAEIQPLMIQAVSMSQAAADRKRVRLVMDFDGQAPLPPLSIDPVKIYHAIDSLVASTVKFSRPGSRIEIGVGSRAGKATIWLRTDGSGISAGALRSLFNPFRKNRMSRPGVEGGTALSLAKAKRIVEAHGGVTHVHSGEAKDLTIRLTLPLQKRAVAHQKAGHDAT